MKIIWCMFLDIWTVADWIFLTLDQFLPFYSRNNPKNHNLDKMKKTTRDIIILYKFTINENHMMYVFWDTKHGRSFCRFGPSFCPFTPLTGPKNQSFEKMKQKLGDIIILNKSNKNYDHMLHRSIAHDGCNFHFLFSTAFFPLKAPGDITILPILPKFRIRWCMVPEILVWRTDSWMDGEVKYRGGRPALLFIKNIWIL